MSLTSTGIMLPATSLAQAQRETLGTLRELLGDSIGDCPHDESDLDKIVERVKLVSPTGKISITCCSLGATVESIVLEGAGEMVYRNSDNWFGDKTGYNGRSCGRLAGRTRNYSVRARNTIDEDEVISSTLDETKMDQLLHGGKIGFSYRLWRLVNTFRSQKGSRAVFEVDSPHMDQGHPGAIRCEVHLIASEDDQGRARFDVRYRAKLADYSPCAALANLTSHCYFNLSAGKTNCLEHELALPTGRRYLPQFLTTELKDTHGTEFDFATQQKKVGLPLDHYFLCSSTESGTSEPDRIVSATLFSPSSRVQMRILSTCPGVQVYTGQHCDFKGVCLEMQYPPPVAEMPQFLSRVTLERKLANLSSPATSLSMSSGFGASPAARLRRNSNPPASTYEFDELTTHEFAIV